MNNLLKTIMDIVNLFTKKTPSEPEIKDDVIVEKEQEDISVTWEAKIEPKLIVSDKEPSGGNDRDVWIKVRDRGE